MNKVKRVLISVYDKEGVLEFARVLHGLGAEIISTGGTAELLSKSGIPVVEVSSVTRFPEMLSGRVKTLHPHLHAGLLALRDNAEHMKTLADHRIETIDLVVVNLYPFWDAVKTKTRPEEIIEMIDIGGPSMLRSAAKNYRSVAVVSDPKDYTVIAAELQSTRGLLSESTKTRLAAKVFRLTAYYDGLIRDYFEASLLGEARPVSAAGTGFPQELTLGFKKVQDLRYGENPHQKASLYADLDPKTGGIVGAEKLHGKELSFNNLLDLDAAHEMVSAFSEPACSIIKHNNPCGFAVAKNPALAFKHAYACDPLSAFGSIIGFNRRVDGTTARAVLKSVFVECVVAPDFAAEALTLLKTKKNLRLLRVKGSGAERFDFKKVSGGLLLQEKDATDAVSGDLKAVTRKKVTKSDVAELLFAFKVCRFVKSNAIVITKGGRTLGIGMGQPSRVDSCRIAIQKAGKAVRGAVLASDGFFPKPDSIQLAKKAGIRAIIQPGGSIQDEEVIRACDKAGIPMVLAGVRHFKH